MPPVPEAIGEAYARLLRQLDLRELEADLYEGESADLGGVSVFGGQVLAQALMAAGRAGDGRPPHSVHAYFLRRGDMAEPIRYRVERVRDGRGFTCRAVQALQRERVIFRLMASFHEGEAGFEHAAPAPGAPAPDTLESDLTLRERVAERVPAPVRARLLRQVGLEMRPVSPLDPLQPVPAPPHQQVWLRLGGPAPADALTRYALLAYASDFNLMGTALRPHGTGFWQIRAASLDHALWFHAPPSWRGWLLHDMTSPWAGGGRGLNFGGFYEAGVRIASTAQEGLMRLPRKARTDAAAEPPPSS
ncbi:MAG: thioesterase family protein [Pseudomonadota bacterium]|nr:thioesterase family protein [Pseudomonadota bacterium]